MNARNRDSDVDSDSDDDADSIRPRRPWPKFVAYCPPETQVDVYLLALSALLGESEQCRIDDGKNEDTVSMINVPIADAAVLLRRQYARHETAIATFALKAPSGRLLELGAVVDKAFGATFGPICVACWDDGAFFPSQIPRLKHEQTCSLPLEAAIAWQIALQDSYEIVVRLCTSSPAITRGGCAESIRWGEPLTHGAAYHADGCPAWDLAFSWLDMREPRLPEVTAGFSLDDLRKAVEASPDGSSVCVFQEEPLTREQVLAALALPKEDLLRALEQSATKTLPEWKAIEPDIARVLQEIEKANPNEVEWVPVNQEHLQFIKDHSPAFVRRLENGAVVLLAHPYRTLWPLWADALRLLGIRS